MSIFLIGVPLIFVVILYRNRSNLKNEKVVLKYGYLLKEYKQSAYYWEFVKMMQRMLIIFVINFYSQDQNTKACLILIVLQIYWGVLNRQNPYLNPINNRIDQLLTFACFTSVLLCIFIYKQQYMYFYWASLIVIAALNLYFILYIAKMIGIKYIIQAKKLLYQILLNKYVKKCLKLNESEINKEKELKNIMQNIRRKMQLGISQMKGTIMHFISF